MLMLPLSGLEMEMVLIEEVLFHMEVVIYEKEEEVVAGLRVGESIVSKPSHFMDKCYHRFDKKF